MKQLILPFFILLFFNACSYNNINSVDKKTNIENLSLLIIKSSNNIDKNEAIRFSQDIINQSKYLAFEYKVSTPALIHNTLVNMEIKEKGLCYHYARDLREFLKPKKYKTFKIKTIVANRAEYFEHTALLLTRDDIKFEDSIVLDAWRNTGDLYFSKVHDDKKYIWELK